MQENKAIIIKLSNPREQHYFLVPLEGNNSKGRVPVFGVFGVSVSCCRFLVDTVLKKRRLPVVFDLDETLVHACSCSILREMGKKPEEGKETANRNGSGTDEKDLNLQLVELRLKRVETDRGLLESFMMQAQVSTKTEVLRQQYAETHQYAVAENGTISYLGHIKRPYIKVDDLVLVRINPQDIGTSILIRLRPHWKSAMQLLTGERTPTGESIERPTPIIEAFICTAAQFDYAQEAWRLLDEGGQLVGYRLCES